jgi:hypothetical protein
LRKLLTAWGTLALVSLGFAASGATDLFAGASSAKADRDETILTVQVTSADHEMQEGYFTLGDSTTVMAKPGSDVYKFLARQRGRKVKIVLSEAGGTELSRLER